MLMKLLVKPLKNGNKSICGEARRNGQVVREYTTGTNGMFQLRKLSPGSYTVEAQLGQTITRQAVNIVPGAIEKRIGLNEFTAANRSNIVSKQLKLK